jgi:hypothetical protein
VGHISFSPCIFTRRPGMREKEIMWVWVCDGGFFQPYPPGRCLDEEKSLMLIVGWWILCAL